MAAEYLERVGCTLRVAPRALRGVCATEASRSASRGLQTEKRNRRTVAQRAKKKQTRETRSEEEELTQKMCDPKRWKVIAPARKT
ncbi:hypothetical protein NDU88_003835 [Pleurodeles waltl]|uniref:Uncharacterized protein n=1 Tax=Pleurodeles waltl TaxID=8319 RepID=A0AAV7MC85_PLEWA|nr:hypothetical protein NDU88_003835 [Pleurodeles waltl]